MKNFDLSMAAGVILILIGLASMYISYQNAMSITFGALVFFAGILVVGLAFNLFTKYTPTKARRKRRR